MSAAPSSGPNRQGDAWAEVVDQDEAVALLQKAVAQEPTHAWLFVGPHGSGKRVAARAFAAEVLATPLDAAGDHDGAARTRKLAAAGHHPDIVVVERVGAAILAPQADEIVKRASRSPMEGSRKVLVLDEFHLVAPAAGSKLLKTIEEPPPGTFFVVLAEEVTPDLVTIASRCVRVDFAPLSPSSIVARLEVEGIEPERAMEAAAFAGGDLDRARLLATDERLALRLAAWRELARRLDGTGATVSVAVDELRAAIDDAESPLASLQDAEAAAMTEQVERYGQRGSGAKLLEERHKRERRRLRTDELRMGLASLATTYRDEMATAADPAPALVALEAIQDTAERIIFNPNEELLLIDLALRLPPLP